MITKLVVDSAKLKIVLRYAKAVNFLLQTGVSPAMKRGDVPKGPMRRDILGNIAVAENMKRHAEEVPLPTVENCRNLRTALLMARRHLSHEVALSDDECRVVEEQEYEGFVLRVYERLDVLPPFRYQPLVLKDGKIAHRIFVRSKQPYVSMNHFAKRAVDEFVKTGQWPAKQGLSLAACQ